MNSTDRKARSVTILGATGSIGQSSLKLVDAAPDQFNVEVLSAQNNVAQLAELARKHAASIAVIGDPAKKDTLSAMLADTNTTVLAGTDGLQEAARFPTDVVIAGIVGAAGLAPTLAAVERGAIVGLANKECLVCAGDLFMTAVNRHGTTLLPVDSEHNAIYQVFDFNAPESVSKITLTASGGPFRSASLVDLERVTPERAVKHPNWSMGHKISVDSATLMNKGLEVIEAWHLFPVEKEQIDVIIHPQSVIHSMVSYVDGSVLAQLGSPDMKTPISYALNWPSRMDSGVTTLDLAGIARLDFEEPDENRFPALKMARQALQTGGGAPTILNAANEVAVVFFLNGALAFLDIPKLVESVLSNISIEPLESLDHVMEVDAKARVEATQRASRRN